MKEKIYMFPGFMCDKRLWSKIIPLLENDYEIVHIPLPLSSCFEEINQILDEKLPKEPINVLGFSLGGYVCSYFAIKHPERVKKIFMVSSTAGKPNEKEDKRRAEKIQKMLDFGFEELSYEKSKSLLEEQNQNDEEMIKVLQDMFNDLGYDHFITHLQSTLHRKHLINEMSDLKIPIHFFYSTEDRLLNHPFMKEISERKLNHVTINSRVGTSHNVPLEDPINLVKHIKEWMDTNP